MIRKEKHTTMVNRINYGFNVEFYIPSEVDIKYFYPYTHLLEKKWIEKI